MRISPLPVTRSNVDVIPSSPESRSTSRHTTARRIADPQASGQQERRQVEEVLALRNLILSQRSEPPSGVRETVKTLHRRTRHNADKFSPLLGLAERCRAIQ